MNPTSRKIDEDSQKAINEFLANGGKIEVIPYGKKTEEFNSTASFYGRKKKTKPGTEDT
jgi:hypothetical protein